MRFAAFPLRHDSRVLYYHSAVLNIPVEDRVGYKAGILD